MNGAAQRQMMYGPPCGPLPAEHTNMYASPRLHLTSHCGKYVLQTGLLSERTTCAAADERRRAKLRPASTCTGAMRRCIRLKDPLRLF